LKKQAGATRYFQVFADGYQTPLFSNANRFDCYWWFHLANQQNPNRFEISASSVGVTHKFVRFQYNSILPTHHFLNVGYA
jgi:hypothetical protein